FPTHLSPPPPTSSLFPYTTLFRSGRRNRFHQSGVAADLVGAERLAHIGVDVDSHDHDGRMGIVAAGATCSGPTSSSFHRPSVSLDRKSTRLNSSHVSISYAVFCLK